MSLSFCIDLLCPSSRTSLSAYKLSMILCTWKHWLLFYPEVVKLLPVCPWTGNDELRELKQGIVIRNDADLKCTIAIDLNIILCLAGSYPYPASPSPDDDVFIWLASTYAQTHPHMHKSVECHGSPPFPGGITNGAKWYPVKGGMQDYNYLAHGCMELTLELSCCKYPTSSHLPTLWTQNYQALLKYVQTVHQGLAGVVVDVFTNTPIVGATLQILGRDVTFETTKHGEFWRILLAGSYQLQVNTLIWWNIKYPLDRRKTFVTRLLRNRAEMKARFTWTRVDHWSV